MANRYWIGGTGNWSNTAHWSAASGGAGGASVPTSLDNVFFDASSFLSAGQTVTIDVSPSSLDIDFSGVLNNPTLAGSAQFNISGSLTFSASMSITYTGMLRFESTATGKTIDTKGLPLLSDLWFDGVGGGWTFQSNIVTTGNIVILNGAVNTNSKNVSFRSLDSSRTTTRSLSLGSSILTLTYDWFLATTTGLTFDAGTSTIKMNTPNRFFSGGGLTYNVVEMMANTITVEQSNVFNTLILDAGATVKLTSGTTQSVTNLIANGTSVSPINLQSGTAGSPATISKASGAASLRHCTIKDIAATGGATFTSFIGTNGGGNTGINFVSQLLVGQIKDTGLYWINSSGVLTKISG